MHTTHVCVQCACNIKVAAKAIIRITHGQVSLFSEQLQIAVEAADLNQVELSKRTAINQSTISRWMRGDIAPEAEAFTALLNALPVSTHADLISARLLDEIPAEYRDAILIVPRTSEVREIPPPYLAPQMAKDLRSAIEYLATEAVRVPEIREAIISLAKALGSPSTQPSVPILEQTVEELKTIAEKKARKNPTRASK